MKLLSYFLVFISLFCILAVQPAFAVDPTPTPCVVSTAGGDSSCIMVDQSKLGFRIPSFSEILSFVIRGFFIVGGLAALFYLLLGAFAWITSGGDKEKVGGAQAKIQAAVIGVIMIVVVLAVVVTLEQVVFGRRLCLGLSCPLTIPSLLQPPGGVSTPQTPVLDNIIDTPTPLPPGTKIVVTITPPASTLPDDSTHHY